MQRIPGATLQASRTLLSSSAAHRQRFLDMSLTEGESFPSPTSDQMAQLAKKQNFHGARRVWIHLNSLNLPMKPSIIYADAALFQLQQPRRGDTQDWETAFHDWLALVPAKHEAPNWPRPFSTILDTFLRSSAPRANLPALKRFTLIVAGKGYLRDVWQPFASTFFRLRKPAHAVGYLMQLEDAAVRYEAGLPYPEVRRVREGYRALFIETCARAGWVQEAVNILYASEDVRLPEKTGKLVLERVEAVEGVEDVRIVERILRERPKRFANRKLAESQPPTRPVSEDEILV